MTVLAPTNGTLTRVDAERLHGEIMQAGQVIRRAWVYIAGRLYELHRSEGWRLLGFGTWGSYCEQAKVTRTYADLLVRAWRILVVEGGLAVDQLYSTDLSKCAYVLPAITDGRLSAAEGLANVRAFRREELRNLFVQDRRREESARRCPNCGHVLAREKIAAGAA